MTTCGALRTVLSMVSLIRRTLTSYQHTVPLVSAIVFMDRECYLTNYRLAVSITPTTNDYFLQQVFNLHLRFVNCTVTNKSVCVLLPKLNLEILLTSISSQLRVKIQLSCLSLDIRMSKFFNNSEKMATSTNCDSMI